MKSLSQAQNIIQDRGDKEIARLFAYAPNYKTLGLLLGLDISKNGFYDVIHQIASKLDLDISHLRNSVFVYGRYHKKLNEDIYIRESKLLLYLLGTRMNASAAMK